MISPEHERPSIPLTAAERRAFVAIVMADYFRDHPLRLGEYRRPTPSLSRAPSYHTIGLTLHRPPQTFRLDTA